MTQSSYNAYTQPFWRFSLNFYESEAVRQRCLALQDDYGLDVNLLLFACWLGRQSRSLVSEGAAWQQVRAWHTEIVQPLRALRRAQPRQHEGERHIRQLMQDTELKAEQCEQWILFQAAEHLSQSATEVGPKLTWSNLLDVAEYADQSDSILFQSLQELVELNHPPEDAGGP